MDEMKNVSSQVFSAAQRLYDLFKLARCFVFKVPAHNRESLPDTGLAVELRMEMKKIKM
jgi:hypothetical protein